MRAVARRLVWLAGAFMATAPLAQEPPPAQEQAPPVEEQAAPAEEQAPPAEKPAAPAAGQDPSAEAGIVLTEEGPAPVVDKMIVVNTDRQVLRAWDGNQLVYEFDVVTGRPGKETHAGRFHITRKYEDYTSKTYGAEMPFAMFFTEDGKAFHGTNLATIRSYLHAYLTESVGSMGCVGLTDDEAEQLFDWAPIGTSVLIIEEEPEDD